MNIAVDCRYLGKSGIGRVCQGIIDNLDYKNDTIYLIGNPNKLKNYDKAIIVEDDTNPYSKRGLIKFNRKQINKLCDCIIIPNFLIPFGIKIPIHSVMHDLIFLDVKESVKGKVDYVIKKILLKRCMKKSKSIACVSAFTKSRCEYFFEKYAKKCYVNYNGFTKEIIEYCNHSAIVTKTNDIVFVGNVKGHKGLKTLLDAFSMLQDKSVRLKIIGERDGFLNGLNLADSAYENVTFTGKISDEELYSEIQSAKFLVQPSIYEGFGLPPLEALYLGTKPIISDIPVFHEIYEGFPVTFFRVNDRVDLAKKIEQSESAITDCQSDIIKKYNYKKFVENFIMRIKK